MLFYFPYNPQSIEHLQSFTRYVEYILEHENKVKQLLKKRKQETEYEDSESECTIKMNPMYQSDFYELFQLIKKLLTNPASNLENI